MSPTHTTPQEQPDGHTKDLVHSGPREASIPTARVDRPVTHG